MMGIRGTHRLIVVILVSALLSIGCVSIIVVAALEFGHRHFQVGVEDSLTTVLRATNETLNLWARQKKEYLQLFGTNQDLADLVQALLLVAPEPETLLASEELKQVRDYFQLHEDAFGSEGFFIISPDFISIGSKRDNVGTRNFIADAYPDLLASVVNRREGVFIPPIYSDVPLADIQVGSLKNHPPTMFFAAPVLDEKKRLIAIVTQRVKPQFLFSKSLKVGWMGETGETYALDERGRLLSESRYAKTLQKVGLISTLDSLLAIEIRDPGGDLRSGYRPLVEHLQQPLTRMALALTHRQSGSDLQGYRNYLGIPVFGAWLWNRELNVGLAAEIQVEEVSRPYHLLRAVIIGLVVVAFVAAALTAGWIWHSSRAADRELTARLRRKFISLTEHTPVGIFWHESNGNMLYLNPAGCALCGIEQSEAVENLWQKHLHPEDRELVSQRWQAFIDQKDSFASEHRFVLPDRVVWVYAQAVQEIDASGRVAGLVGTLTDITELKQNESKLVDLLRMLSQSNASLREFAYVSSHDLAAPVRTILSYIELLQEDYAKGKTLRIEEDIKYIHEAAIRMQRLIDSLLDFSRATNKELKLVPVSLNEVVNEAVANLASNIEERSAQIFCDPLPILQVDRSQLVRVFQNLISNAVKYCLSRPEIRISAREERESWLIDVQDNGIGIEEKYQEMIFKPFQRLHSDDGFAGTGIGLSVVQKVIERHHGEILLSSALGRGSTFTISIPKGVRR